MMNLGVALIGFGTGAILAHIVGLGWRWRLVLASASFAVAGLLWVFEWHRRRQ